MTHTGIKSHRCSLKSDGFMLIEVLVALALFGLAAVFLVDGVSSFADDAINEGYARNGAGSSLGQKPDFQGASV